MRSRKPWQRTRSRVKDCLLWVRSALEPVAGLEWLCLCMLGAVMALVSFFMDLSVTKLLRAQHWLYSHLEGHRLLQFLSWTVYPVSLCTLSSSFSHSLCPQSAGSGLPEVRTILSGVELPDYLSLTNLFAKLVGLICTLAAGSSVFLGKVVTSHRDMLVAAAAVGVGSCFGAPISGVLFSVEVMGTHFVLGLLPRSSRRPPSSRCPSSGSKLSMKQLLTSLLDSRQWWSLSQNASVRPPQESTPESLWQEWSPSGVSVYHTLGFFLVMKLWMLVLACTLPLPAGYFMPAFIYGAAAFSGAVTHTLSPALLALELTGQSTHAAPVLLATLTANAVARSRLRPSFYDAVSVAKRLPHLPSLLRAQPELSSVRLGQVLSGRGRCWRGEGGPPRCAWPSRPARRPRSPWWIRTNPSSCWVP
ncbi:hypothetical protein ANANG_G00227580 [Anguilla anguilla]|uniref:Chloride channel protein n=1 Tax=Anguilla anguilla TaxID=7936 RepID=A0A9D3RTA9_ANGAN|nr:hypothetical protein ANANG_G00227580 [Anguilla anguilla]